MRYKYPRTPHLPWSLGATNDDKILKTTEHFVGKNIIVSRKMDGECTTLYSDYVHARSVDYSPHESRNLVKALQAKIGYLIPNGWRICGENMYAKHSILYEDLESDFLVFSIWTDENICLRWHETMKQLDWLGLATVPVLYSGPYNEDLLKDMATSLDLEKQEGYVVRLANEFHYDNFAQSVAKYVRAQHVQTDEHWLTSTLVRNGVKK